MSKCQTSIKCIRMADDGDKKDQKFVKYHPNAANIKKIGAQLRETMSGEIKKAMQSPRSRHGGPVRISSGVPMKFPYTYSAKLVQFPWKYYFHHNWIWKYYLVAVVVSIPLFKKISNLANSKENKEKWAATKRKEAHHEH